MKGQRQQSDAEAPSATSRRQVSPLAWRIAIRHGETGRWVYSEAFSQLMSIASKTHRTPSSPFRFESEMTDPVEALVRRLTPGQVRPEYVLREMPAGQGVVDLLAADFDDEVLSRRVRAGLGPIELPLRIEVLSHLRPDRFLSLERLARRVGSNPRALTRSTLRPLAEMGAIELEPTRARATGAWIPVAKRLTAIELKLSKWRDAARQADNAAWAADRSWVVLDARRASAAVRNRDYFTEFGIGLAVVDSGGVLQVVERPRRARCVPWLRAWLGELAWARVAACGDTHAC